MAAARFFTSALLWKKVMLVKRVPRGAVRG
jgi:hypothetical protein